MNKKVPWWFAVFALIVLAIWFNWVADNPDDAQGLERGLRAASGVRNMDDIARQVAEDEINKYAIVSRHGDRIKICAQAGMVVAALLQAKDDERYRKWQAIESDDCGRNRQPPNEGAMSAPTPDSRPMSDVERFGPGDDGFKKWAKSYSLINASEVRFVSADEIWIVSDARISANLASALSTIAGQKYQEFTGTKEAIKVVMFVDNNRIGESTSPAR